MHTIPYIKICGLREPDNILQVAGLNPDYMGFIFYPPSKRYVGTDSVLPEDIPDTIKKVGVFVNALIPEVVRQVNRLSLDFVQLHGDEPPEYCRELSDVGVHIIKAFSVDQNFNFKGLQAYLTGTEYFLFDTRTPLRGGSGKSFDWNILQHYPWDKPFFLSGGIGPEDADSIREIRQFPLHAIDINSRFESAPAIKDIVLLRSFIAAIRQE